MSADKFQRLLLLYLHVRYFTHLPIFLQLEYIAAGVHPETPQSNRIVRVAHAQLRSEVAAQRNEAMKHDVISQHPRTEHCKEYHSRGDRSPQGSVLVFPELYYQQPKPRKRKP